ncbi:MAG: CotH kinase family protein [Thermodesulfobacteriota bacterium]
MGKPTVKLRNILLLILAALLLSFSANRFVFRKGPPEKVADTTIRSRLLQARKNVELTGFLGSASNERYSSLIYDVAINLPGSGPLPWATSIPAGPTGRYEFTWRLKISFKSLFSITEKDSGKKGLIVKLTNSKGLPLYSRFLGFSVPGENVTLPPGIYVLHVSSKQPLTSLVMSFSTAEAAGPMADAPQPSAITDIDLRLNQNSVKDLKRLVAFGEGSTDTMIVKMPSARVKAGLFLKNKRIGNVKIGLSGRSRVHLEWFPSIDIKVTGGRSVMGMPSFKLYRLDTKDGILEFVFLSIMQDMGFFTPRHELVLLKVNGESQGVYLLMETTTQAMFSNTRRLEGDIIGVDLEKLFFDYPYGADLDVRYFFKAKGTGYERPGREDFFSTNFADTIDPQSLARYIAFSSVYLAAHGLGIDDLRFYMEPTRRLFFPLPRDMSPVFIDPRIVYRQLFSHLGWLRGAPPYTIWPVTGHFNGDYSFTRNREVFSGVADDPNMLVLSDIHPAVVSFVSEARNLALVNKYFKYFLSNEALLKKVQSRVILALREVLSTENNSELIQTQNETMRAGKPFNLIAIKDYLGFIDDNPTEVNLDGGKAFWNKRTSMVSDPSLSPALLRPVDLAADKNKNQREMSLAFSVEAQIFDFLEDSGLDFISKSYGPLPAEEAPYRYQLKKKKSFTSPFDSQRAAMILDDVATYIFIRTTDKGRAILIFLVRNDSGKNSDYRIIKRGALRGTQPLINKVFYAAGGKGQAKANMDDILKRRFIKGEQLRLLVFDLPLVDKPAFYRLKVPEDGYFTFPPYMYLPSLPSGSIETAQANEPLPEWAHREDNGIHVQEGSVITLNKTLTLEAGAEKDIFIEKGVTFKIAPGAGLIIKSNLNVNGTDERPVKFLSQSTKPWRGLFVGQDDKAVMVSLENVIFDNFGTFPKTTLGGLKLNGGLTMLMANVSMKNVEIRNAHSEDALNFINSTANLQDIILSGSFSDSIDMDFSDARIEGLTIENAGGDGLDLSNSLILCLDSVFINSTDKGISIGEMSNVVIKRSRFIGNGTGIANKDQSFISVEGSSFEKNGTAISEFIKKPWFGKPGKTLSHNTYRNNRKKYTWLGFHTY